MASSAVTARNALVGAMMPLIRRTFDHTQRANLVGLDAAVAPAKP